MKTKMLSKKIGYWAGVIAIGTVLGLSLQFAKAWVNAPLTPPPGGNVGAPINTGANIQNKTNGAIGLQNLSATGVIKAGAVGNIFTAGDVAGKRLCIGNVCKDAWPDAGTSQTSQWITAGNNVYYNKGNVGIGTSNPTSKLTVSGEIKSTGDICTDAGGGKCLSSVSSKGQTVYSCPNSGGTCNGNLSMSPTCHYDYYTNVCNCWTTGSGQIYASCCGYEKHHIVGTPSCETIGYLISK